MASALIGAGTSLLGSVLGGKGAAKAAKAQAAAQQAAIAEQQRQFNVTQQNEAPFLQGGTTALNGSGGLMDLLGLNGNDAQAAGIAALKASPQFTSQYDTGADTVLQNAAATGGLRGGNTNMSLANFGSSLLSQVLGNQVGNLGSLVSLGSGTAGQLGQFGQQASGNISNLLNQQGNTQANGILGQTNAYTNGLNDLSKLNFGGIFGGNGQATNIGDIVAQTNANIGKWKF